MKQNYSNENPMVCWVSGHGLWYNFLVLGVLLLALNDATGQIAKSGASEDQTQTQTMSKMEVWAVPAEQKVRPEDRIESENLVWSQKEKSVRIAGAGNEHAPFQIVITVPIPPGRRPKAAEGFFIEASDLTSPDGKTISQKQVSFYLQHYIMLYAKSSPVGATGYWPDALAPIKEPFNMNAQYAVVGNRPIWVDVSILPATPAGKYKGKISISQNDKVQQTINLELEVYNFSLPEKTHLITYMNISKGQLARFYNKPSDSEDIEKLTQTYYEFLYAHRMEPWFNDPLEPEVRIAGEKVTVSFNEDRYQYYLTTLKTKRVLLNAYPHSLERQIGADMFSDSFNQKVKSYLSQVAAYFEKRGWKDRLVFNSPIDEPNTKEDFEETRKWAKLVHEAAEGVPFLSTKTPLPPKDNPDWGTLRGHVDNFSIHGNAMNNPLLKQAIAEEQANGGEMTWYISCDQIYPQPNYFIDAPALDPVMVPWITARYNMDGFLYWACNCWSETPDPWLDAVMRASARRSDPSARYRFPTMPLSSRYFMS
jgi:hypothetical protein